MGFLHTHGRNLSQKLKKASAHTQVKSKCSLVGDPLDAVVPLLHLLPGGNPARERIQQNKICANAKPLPATFQTVFRSSEIVFEGSLRKRQVKVQVVHSIELFFELQTLCAQPCVNLKTHIRLRDWRNLSIRLASVSPSTRRPIGPSSALSPGCALAFFLGTGFAFGAGVPPTRETSRGDLHLARGLV